MISNTSNRAIIPIRHSARSRTSPTGRLSVPRSTIAEILSSLSRVTSTMKYAARAFRPDIGLIRGAHDRDNDPVRAQCLAGAFECVAADGVDDRIEGPGGQLRANAAGRAVLQRPLARRRV